MEEEEVGQFYLSFLSAALSSLCPFSPPLSLSMSYVSSSILLSGDSLYLSGHHKLAQSLGTHPHMFMFLRESSCLTIWLVPLYEEPQELADKFNYMVPSFWGIFNNTQLHTTWDGSVPGCSFSVGWFLPPTTLWLLTKWFFHDSFLARRYRPLVKVTNVLNQPIILFI